MAKSVNETFRQYLPGAGKDTLGNPKQGKTRVVGRINVTSYTLGGEALVPRDVNLARIDWLNLRVADEVGGADGEQVRTACYNQTNDVFYLFVKGGDNVTRQAAAASTETVEYCAEGDSAYDVELS
jgi:hypothetical protein